MVFQTLTEWEKLLRQGLGNGEVSPFSVELADQLVQDYKYVWDALLGVAPLISRLCLNSSSAYNYLA